MSHKPPDGYVFLDRLPIFEAHERKKADGTEYTVTDEDLEEAVLNYERRERERGMRPLLFFGHRIMEKGVPESSQPAPQGYWCNLAVETMGRGKGHRKKAIFADRYVRADKVDEARTYPHWSAEYYRGRKEITAVSLLRLDPQLDLGMCLYGRDASGEVYMLGGDSMSPMGSMDPTGLPNAATPDAQEEARIMAVIQARFPGLMAMHEAYTAAGASAVPSLAPPAAPAEGGLPGMPGEDPMADQSAAMGDPMGGDTNGSPPPLGEEEDEEEEEEPMTPEQMARQERMETYVRQLGQQVQAQAAKITALEQKEQALELDLQSARAETRKISAQARQELAATAKENRQIKGKARLARLRAEPYGLLIPETVEERIMERYLRCTDDFERDEIDNELLALCGRDPTVGDMVRVAADVPGVPSDKFTARDEAVAYQYMRDQTAQTGVSPPWEAAEAYAITQRKGGRS